MRVPPNTPVFGVSVISTSPVKRVVEAFAGGVYPNRNSPEQGYGYLLKGYALSSSPVKSKMNAFLMTNPQRVKDEDEESSPPEFRMDDI